MAWKLLTLLNRLWYSSTTILKDLENRHMSMELLHLFAEPGKTVAKDLALLIAIPIFLGIAIFGFGYSKEKDGGHPAVKFFGFVPLLVAAYMGWPYYQYSTDKMTKELGFIGGSSETMYKLSFLGPVGLIVVLAILSFILKRFMDNETRI